VAREDAGVIAAAAFRQGFVTVSARGFLHAYRDRAGGKPPAPEPWLGWALSAPASSADFSITRAHAAADLASGRIAVTSSPATTGDQLVVLQARHGRSVHEVTRLRLRAMATGICFHDREHVIVAGREYVERLRVSPRNYYQQTAARPLRGARDLVLVNGRDEVCALDDSGAVAYFSASSLDKAREPRELAGLRGTALWGAPGNVSHALGGDGAVHVVTRELLALQELADRPMTAWQPADAATLARAEVVVARCPAARPLHGLLAACLDQKFGGDVRPPPPAPPSHVPGSWSRSLLRHGRLREKRVTPAGPGVAPVTAGQRPGGSTIANADGYAVNGRVWKQPGRAARASAQRGRMPSLPTGGVRFAGNDHFG
jgi:hypothetical protein